MASMNYLLNEAWDEFGDQRVNKFYLMGGGPLKVLALISVYLLFVKCLGPRFMEKREPFDLRSVILIFNSLLLGLNGIGFVLASWLTGLFAATWDCSPIDRSDTFHNQIFLIFGYMYFVSKIADLFDTIFFVLRKKQTHVTILHVFHHSVMVPVGAYAIHRMKFIAFKPKAPTAWSANFSAANLHLI